MKYKQIPSDTFKKLVVSAGILCSSFTPSSGTVSGLLGATTGGTQFQATPTFKDYGEDIDNCPKNTMELKKLERWDDVKISGTFISADAALVKSLIAAADVASGKITPRNDLATTDFADIWLVGDYSDDNSTDKGGHVAIHLMNALSTGGFQLKTQDEEKGQFAFVYTAHYSIEAQDTVPFEVYVKDGGTAYAT